MDNLVFAQISQLDTLLNSLLTLKALKQVKVQQRALLEFTSQGCNVHVASYSQQIIGQASIRPNEFEIYNMNKDKVEIMLDLSELIQALSVFKAFTEASVRIRYPYKDAFLLLYHEDNACTLQYRLNTLIPEPIPPLELSEKVNAEVECKDHRLLKQAFDVACAGRQDAEVFISFSHSKPQVRFVKDDSFGGLKSQVVLPMHDSLKVSVHKPSEFHYSAQALRSIAIPSASQINFRVFEEGTLELYMQISNDAWIKHYINPLEVM